MHYHLISIFPEIFTSFLETSLIAKAKEKGLISFDLVNPRNFSDNKHAQIDDEPYGGGAGMVMKAKPIIDAIKSIISKVEILDTKNKEEGKFIEGGKKPKIKVIFLSPSETIFDQKIAHNLVDDYDHTLLICGRYEGIDHRVELWCQKVFGEDFCKISVGRFITLGGEVPAMNIVEATARLVPGVIKEDMSWKAESYRPEQGGEKLEHPHYTRPQTVEGFEVPKVLLSGHHAEIEKRREG